MIDAETHERYWEAGSLAGYAAPRGASEAMIGFYADNAFLDYLTANNLWTSEEDPEFWECNEAFITAFKVAYKL